LEELRAGGRAVRLDLSKLHFMDSTGVHVLLEAFNSASSDGSQFQIEPNPSAQVARARNHEPEPTPRTQQPVAYPDRSCPRRRPLTRRDHRSRSSSAHTS
jgi:hypothetical protein